MKNDTPHILLINPWIHDFAAYDFWAKPVGLLNLASILEYHGFGVSYLDCLDRFHPQAPKTDPLAKHGRGPYLKTHIPKPKGLDNIPRNYARYGIQKNWFRKDLQSIETPDLVLITSLMTYWYPGVQETIEVIKEIFPHTPIILGGIYTTLCHDHAVKYSGASKVVTGAGEKDILKLAQEYTGFSVHPKFDPDDLDTYPYPAFALQRTITYIPLLTSRGCPFSCTYCASHFLNPKRMLRTPESVVEEIIYWHAKYGVIDFVFYDDALLVDAERHAVPIFEGIDKAGLNVCFHTPNAVHIREITTKTANLMFKVGFKTLRLGLETSEFDKRDQLDGKVNAHEFKRAIDCLRSAGFDQNQVGVYLLAGLPGQSLSSIEDSIKTVRQSGITPVLAHYTPIPHTAIWDKAVACSIYDLESDPLFTNNAIFPCLGETFSWKTISYLKNIAAK